MLFKLSKFFATYLFVGLLPKAPGTWGSFFALPLAWLLYKLGTFWYIVLYDLITALGIVSSYIYSKGVGKEDPDEVVIDEVAGILTVFLIVEPSALNLFLGFLLFRLLDITKPFPINRLEKLPYGVGIMVDDIAAGFLTGLLLWGVDRLISQLGAVQ
jgi:phosphatidylglycerophosphatase A